MAISIIRLTLATGSDHHQIYHRDQVSTFAIIETLKISSITSRAGHLQLEIQNYMGFYFWRQGSPWPPMWWDTMEHKQCWGQMPGWWLMVIMAPPILHTLHSVQDTCPVPHLLHSIIPALDKQWHTIIATTIKHSYSGQIPFARKAVDRKFKIALHFVFDTKFPSF